MRQVSGASKKNTKVEKTAHRSRQLSMRKTDSRKTAIQEVIRPDILQAEGEDKEADEFR